MKILSRLDFPVGMKYQWPPQKRDLVAACSRFCLQLSGTDGSIAAFNTFLEELNYITQGKGVALWEISPDKEYLQIKAYAGQSEEFHEVGARLAKEHENRLEAPIYQVFREQETMMFDDLCDPDNAVHIVARMFGYNSVYIAPITVREERIGVLVFYQPTNPAFEPSELLDWATLASHEIALAYEQKTLLGYVEEALELSRKSERSKDSLLSAVSHELRTPLTVIQGFTELLEDGVAGEVTSNQKEYLSTVGKAIRQMRSIVDDIIDTAAIANGRFTMRYQHVEFGVLVEDACAPLRLIAERKGLRLLVDVDKSIELDADDTRIRQAVTNLVENSIKFTDKGAVSVRAYMVDSMVRVEVSDTGCGIESNELPKIFDSFYRIDSSLVRETSGVGLGLSLVASIVQAHGGSVNVSSEVSVGTTFTILIPKDCKERSGRMRLPGR